MIYTVDRIEENETVVCFDENENIVKFAFAEIPENTREGSVLRETDSGLVLDGETEEERRQSNFEKACRLFDC